MRSTLKIQFLFVALLAGLIILVAVSSLTALAAPGTLWGVTYDGEVTEFTWAATGGDCSITTNKVLLVPEGYVAEFGADIALARNLGEVGATIDPRGLEYGELDWPEGENNGIPKANVVTGTALVYTRYGGCAEILVSPPTVTPTVTVTPTATITPTVAPTPTPAPGTLWGVTFDAEVASFTWAATGGDCTLSVNKVLLVPGEYVAEFGADIAVARNLGEVGATIDPRGLTYGETGWPEGQNNGIPKANRVEGPSLVYTRYGGCAEILESPQINVYLPIIVHQKGW